MSMSEFKRAAITLDCVRVARDHRWDVQRGNAPEWITENLDYWEGRVNDLEAAEKEGALDDLRQWNESLRHCIELLAKRVTSLEQRPTGGGHGPPA